MREQKRDDAGGPRIVVQVTKADWRCLLCGAAVVHVDDHYEWHLQVDRILLAVVLNQDEGT